MKLKTFIHYFSISFFFPIFISRFPSPFFFQYFFTLSLKTIHSHKVPEKIAHIQKNIRLNSRQIVLQCLELHFFVVQRQTIRCFARIQTFLTQNCLRSRPSLVVALFKLFRGKIVFVLESISLFYIFNSFVLFSYELNCFFSLLLAILCFYSLVFRVCYFLGHFVYDF